MNFLISIALFIIFYNASKTLLTSRRDRILEDIIKQERLEQIELKKETVLRIKELNSIVRIRNTQILENIHRLRKIALYEKKAMVENQKMKVLTETIANYLDIDEI